MNCDWEIRDTETEVGYGGSSAPSEIEVRCCHGPLFVNKSNATVSAIPISDILTNNGMQTSTAFMNINKLNNVWVPPHSRTIKVVNSRIEMGLGQHKGHGGRRVCRELNRSEIE
jgi:hypothetical protein